MKYRQNEMGEKERHFRKGVNLLRNIKIHYKGLSYSAVKRI